MPEQILVLQHNPKAPIGVIGDELRQLNATLTNKNLLHGDTVAGQELDNYHGLVVLGGPISAYNERYDQQLRETVDIILHFHHHSKPVLGICLGAQLLARAFGQPYRSNNGWETGFTAITLTDAGKQDPLIGGLGEPPRLFEFHEDGFFIPEEAELIMCGQACTNQGYRIGPTSYGFQFHPEVTADITRGWASVLSAEVTEIDSSALNSLTDSNPEDFAAQAKFAQQLAQRWLAMVREQMVQPALAQASA